MVAVLVVLLIERRRVQARLAVAEREREEAAGQLDRRISELFSLRELSFVLSESLELRHIVEQVARYARRFLQAEGAIVVLGESGRPGLEVVAAEGSLTEYLGLRSDGGATLVRTAIERGRIEVVQDSAAKDVALFGAVMAAAAAVVPLRIRGENLGAIAVTDRVGGPFTTEDLWLLSTVATNASVAIGNSQLFEIVERGRREWETAFNALREGIAVVGPDGAIQRANSALAKLAGVGEADLIGREFRETLFGGVESASALIDSARSGQYPAPTVLRISPDRSLRLTVAPLAGAVGAVVALVEDVTRQRALEAQLFQNEKMAAIGQLVSGVAHELNNPLTSIAGLTELLLERDPGDEPPRQHLKVIHEQADRAGRIVRNLLTFVRKGASEQAPFDVNEVVPRTTMLVAYEMRVREIELVTQVSAEPLMVMGDHNEVQQVLLNLLTNAVQAVSDLAPGRRRAVAVETRREGDRALLVVRDTGDGVPEEYVPNLFTPFFTTKAEGQGTGLGLSLSYGLIQAHRGSLSYAPVGSGGAEFTVNLPLAESPAPLQHPGARRILVADDDAATHRVMAALFAPDGFVVDGARAGAQALQLVERNDYDLLIADATRAGPSGAPLVSELIADVRWRDRLLTIGGRHGGTRVSKPFDLRQVRALAEKILDKVSP